MRTATEQRYPLLPERDHVIRLNEQERKALAKASVIFAEVRSRARKVDPEFEWADLDTDLALGEHICREWSEAVGGMNVEDQRYVCA